MTSAFRLPVVALWLVLAAPGMAAQPEVKVAVVGGLELSGAWQAVEAAAQEALGMTVTTVAAAPKERVVPAFTDGKADLLLIHGGDETFALQGTGYAAPLRTWGYNGFAFVGPDTDPAGVAQAPSGEAAIRRIHAAGEPVIVFRDAGSYNILQRLLDQAGLIPSDLQSIADSARPARQVLALAAREQAYVLVGHIPVAFGRMSASGVRVLFSGDPAMRRAYVIATPGPRHPAGEPQRANAERLAEYLLSDAGQDVLRQAQSADGQPWIHPRDGVGVELFLRRNAGP